MLQREVERLRERENMDDLEYVMNLRNYLHAALKSYMRCRDVVSELRSELVAVTKERDIFKQELALYRQEQYLTPQESARLQALLRKEQVRVSEVTQERDQLRASLNASDTTLRNVIARGNAADIEVVYRTCHCPRCDLMDWPAGGLH